MKGSCLNFLCRDRTKIQRPLEKFGPFMKRGDYDYNPGGSACSQPIEFTKLFYAIDKSLRGDLLRGEENKCRNGGER